jgi:hypothetical protein
MHSLFQVFVYEGERIIAEFDGVAIQAKKTGSAIPDYSLFSREDSPEGRV